MKKAITRRSECPIGYGLDLFGDKWTLLVMRDTLLFERSRFREFAPREHIATNILTNRLERLVADGFITKTRDSQLKNQFVYAPTEKGWQLLPIIIDMMFWGFQNDPEAVASKQYIARIKAERATVLREVTEAIEHHRFPAYRRDVMGVQISSV